MWSLNFELFCPTPTGIGLGIPPGGGSAVSGMCKIAFITLPTQRPASGETWKVPSQPTPFIRLIWRPVVDKLMKSPCCDITAGTQNAGPGSKPPRRQPCRAATWPTRQRNRLLDRPMQPPVLSGKDQNIPQMQYFGVPPAVKHHRSGSCRED